jgi:hypothetical protein
MTRRILLHEAGKATAAAFEHTPPDMTMSGLNVTWSQRIAVRDGPWA